MSVIVWSSDISWLDALRWRYGMGDIKVHTCLAVNLGPTQSRVCVYKPMYTHLQEVQNG